MFFFFFLFYYVYTIIYTNIWPGECEIESSTCVCVCVSPFSWTRSIIREKGAFWREKSVEGWLHFYCRQTKRQQKGLYSFYDKILKLTSGVWGSSQQPALWPLNAYRKNKFAPWIESLGPLGPALMPFQYKCLFPSAVGLDLWDVVSCHRKWLQLKSHDF